MVDEKFKLLIVDDNPQNLQVLGNLLEKNNYLVEYAQSGSEALEWIKTEMFDLILLDIMMPGMDGFEVCREIRKNKDFDDVPVIFLTAKTDKYSVVKGFELNAQDYISKPFDTTELTARIKTHIELKSSKDKLKNVNTWLEEKVNEKTKELSETNKKLNETLIEIQKLDKMKNHFLHLTSNEIRTPLTGIVGTLHLLKNQEAATTLKDLIELLEKSITRLESFASKAILTTELSSNSYSYKMEMVNLTELIRFCLLDYNEVIFKKNIQLLDKMDNSLLVHADKELLSKLFSFIIENAISHTPDGKTIEIETIRFNSKVKCTITDFGEGFSENDPDEIFSPFTFNNSDYHKVNDMSMYIAKLISELHNGELKIYNKAGTGGTVEIILNINNNK
ncbi:MAG: hypothetical protein A2X13_02240 [Bacteroidetes bacterium GWC2_33_15]|nr:MAG: hypothetical protein A2X10_07385 [Bacteroidetes bacterium GWA2_33_15]OFX52294.1 MAG: hypothetical protein A2X13_02240 [Bacteroidetes bacterium GWC2_33_15]OFX64448.1 MAG: hypothetical protein A2X15_13060 [Bacteroidetes bacterium GWB2_32_14]OFX67853.1 MAG: hypothetical protein A2X14_06885 [Bacteroidetes bacterium GWD2_33_33]HAN19472.1 hypothetical protein [Bacteroidales bacterium]